LWTFWNAGTGREGLIAKKPVATIEVPASKSIGLGVSEVLEVPPASRSAHRYKRNV
jgi:hypothetical protein